MLRRSVLAAFLGFSTTLNIDAQVHVGAGAESCGRWLESRAAKSNKDVVSRFMMISWAQGYLMGYAHGGAREILKNKLIHEAASQLAQGKLSTQQLDQLVEAVASEDSLQERLKREYGTTSGWLFDVPKVDTVEGWLDRYCQEHRTERILQAIATLRDELMGD